MKVKEIKEIAGTKWLSFKEAIYLDKTGAEQKWQYIERQKDTMVVTVVCKAKGSNKYLFISQPRVPVNKVVISFPAGLVDAGESAEVAALRELKEETGYDGKVVATSMFMPKSAGLTSETTTVVSCMVDPAAVGKTEMEQTEDIQHFWLTPAAFMKMIATMDQRTMAVESDCWNYMAGLTGWGKAAPGKKKKIEKSG
ncbi:MAG: NUDIX domain-containing protein [Candidatus Sigynarchaeota archaeon]